MFKILALCLIVFGSVVACGQSAVDLGSRYRSITAYQVRPGVLMTAKYDADGQACEMTFEKQHTMQSKIDLGSSLSAELVRDLIDEFAAETVRGRQTNSHGFGKHDDNSDIFGDLVITKFEFENVSAKTIGSASAGESIVLIIRWKKRGCV